MITRNKAEKTEHSKFLFGHLWRGKTRDVLTYLETQIKARNQNKLDELITYITKHETEIINYVSSISTKFLVGALAFGGQVSAED